MATRKPRKKSKKEIKAAADRAEARSKGETATEAVEEPSALEPPVHPGGRPTDYDPKFCDKAISACARGATISDLADMLDVHRATIYRWMAEHQEFCDSIKVAREIADERVGFSLYERAVGYTYDAVKIMQSEGSPLIVPYKEHVPPDVNAQRIWLYNRQPEKWRDLSKIEHSGPDGGAIQVENKGDIDQARRVAFALGRAFERQQKMKVLDSEAG